MQLSAVSSPSLHSHSSLGKEAILSRGSRGRRRNGRTCKWRASLEKEEAQVEIERAKAREALRRLDQQLNSLSQPQIQSPSRTKTPLPTSNPEPDLGRDFMNRGREEMPEISDSFLAYTAAALVILTILNNIIFNSFIKPSVDGYEKVTKLERVPLSEPE